MGDVFPHGAFVVSEVEPVRDFDKSAPWRPVQQNDKESGLRGDDLPAGTYSRAWQAARETALAPDAVASPLARRRYDLRHAAVSTWLNAGVPSTQVAEWAGHRVAVLLQIYAKCIADALGEPDDAETSVRIRYSHR